MATHDSVKQRAFGELIFIIRYADYFFYPSLWLYKNNIDFLHKTPNNKR